MSTRHPAAAAALRQLAEVDERLRPLHDHVIVAVEAPPELRHGLVIPETARGGETGVGTVVVVGPGRYDRKTGKRREMEVHEGDRVAYEVFRAIHKVELGEATFAVLEQRHILGVLEDEDGEIEVWA